MSDFYPPNDELVQKVPKNSRFVLINAAAIRTKKMIENKTIIPINYKQNKYFERALEEIYNNRIKIILSEDYNKEDFVKLIGDQYLL